LAGRKPSCNRISRCFYWPTMSRDVADYCCSCETCHHFQHHKPGCAPLISLTVIEEPFVCVAMDIVGTPPHSQSGNRCVLTLCDYGTKYSEAVPLCTIIDAETHDHFLESGDPTVDPYRPRCKHSVSPLRGTLSVTPH